MAMIGGHARIHRLELNTWVSNVATVAGPTNVVQWVRANKKEPTRDRRRQDVSTVTNQIKGAKLRLSIDSCFVAVCSHHPPGGVVVPPWS
jgi:hypothetical protein